MQPPKLCGSRLDRLAQDWFRLATEQLCVKYHISPTTLGRYRRKLNLPERPPGPRVSRQRVQLEALLNTSRSLPPLAELQRRTGLSERTVRRILVHARQQPVYRCPVCDGPSIGRRVHQGCENETPPPLG